MPLDVYQQKRDFDRTPEPSGDGGAASSGALRYVIQKHDATRLHYDFRLELDGVLLSWAVPKGPSLAVGEKRLAVQTEDHPLDYADFEGVIPDGEYGGGPVIVWDTGVWQPDGDPRAALAKGSMTFRLDGHKLHGGWRLVRTRGGKPGKETWLLMKRRDDFADDTRSLVDEAPASVLSGRTSDDVRAGREAVDEGIPVDGIGADGMQFATAASEAPSGDGWLHEIKLDGYRLLAHKDRGAVRLVTRSGEDWTARFGPVAAAVGRLPIERAVLDGEVVVFDRAGRSDFGALQAALSRGQGDYVLQAFDLLAFDGHDLRDQPLIERKRALARLLEEIDAPALRYTDHVTGGGPAMLREAAALGLEGIVSKRADAPYRAGRSRRWLKIKRGHRQEFVIVGFTEPKGSGRHLGALLLGVHRGGALAYVGKCGAGFDDETRATLRARLEPLRRETATVPDAPAERGRRWVEPTQVAEVRFSGWTRAGRVRHAVFVGLRDDKDPRAVVVEEAEMPSDDAGEKTAEKAPKKTGRRSAGRSTVAGVAITHPDRVLWPDLGLSKLELARYFEVVAERLLVGVAERPLSVLRCPEGPEAQCFFQKQPMAGLPAAVQRVDVGDGKDNLMVRDVEGLVTLAQFGVVEVHPWGARADRLDRPDVLVWDLDPGEGVAWKRVVATALTLRDHLTALGLVPFLRATGGKGLHVVVPIERRTPWDVAKDFTHAIATAFAEADPEHYIDRADKAARAGRIFIDYLRNGRGATAVANWSPRARPGAPVAHPLAWDALDGEADGPPVLTVRDVLDAGLPDAVWGDFGGSARRLTKAMIAGV